MSGRYTGFCWANWESGCRRFAGKLSGQLAFSTFSRVHTLTLRRLLKRYCIHLALFLVSGCLLHTSAESANASVSIDNVAVGFDSLFRVGRYTQIRINVTTDSAFDNVTLEVLVPDGEGVRSINRVTGISLRSGENSLETVAKFGRVRSDVILRLMDGTKEFATNTTSVKALLATQHLVLTLGPSVAVGDAISLRQEKKQQETIHGLIKDAAKLPTNWLGYSGVHVIVLPSGSSSLVSQMSEAQLAALNQWVRMGGRLIFSSGASAETMLANSGPLARFAPGTFDRITMQRQISGIENYVGKTEQSLSTFIADGDVAFKLPMTLLSEQRGVPLVSEGIGRERAPLITRASHGFGHVIFVATDLDQGPVSQWKDGRRRLMVRLLDIALGSTKREDRDQQFAQLTQIGFDDLTGQLRAGLDQFQRVKLVPFSWIAVLVGLYILLIGPIDYFVLRRLNQRFSWTWVTFPLAVVAACAVAIALTQHWKGRVLYLNQVDIVDFDAISGQTRSSTWAHLFSPASRKYDIMAQPTEHLFPIQSPRGEVASWQGLPGTSFGGMNTTRVSPSTLAYEIDTDTVEQHQQIGISQLPIDVYASRSLHGLTWGQVDFPEMPLLTADSEDQVKGEVRNPLPVDLRDAVLYFGRLSYPLGTLPPNRGTMIDRFGAKKISSRLTRWKVDLDFKGQSTAWNRKGLDVERIAEIMMFHKAAGGSKYTSLLNRFQGEVDLSDHLEQGTALLVGKIEKRPTELLAKAVEDSNQGMESNTQKQVAFVRILLPVTLKSN